MEGSVLWWLHDMHSEDRGSVQLKWYEMESWLQEHEEVQPMDGAGGSFGRTEEARAPLSAFLHVIDLLSGSSASF